MEVVQLQVEVAKETYELGKGVDGVVASVQKALADGWQPGTDLPVIVVESLQALAPAVQGVEKMPEEAKEDAEKFVDAIYLGLKPIPFRFVKQTPEI